MANKKISELMDATSIIGTDVFPIVDGGVTKKVTLDTLKTFIDADRTLAGLSAVWQESYTNLVSNSAAYLSAVDLSFLSVSGDWNSAYSNLVSNSAAYLSAVDLSFLSVSGNWDSAYSNLVSNSAAYLSAVDLSFLSVSGNWNSAYSTYNSNSASYATISYADSKFFPLTGGTITGATRINGNVTIYGDLSSTGTQTFNNTIFATTSALSVVNVGTGPALVVSQAGTGDIASFYDLDQGVEVLHVGGQNSTYPNVGIKVSDPNKDFTVRGEISASSTIWDSAGNSNQWNLAHTTVNSNSADWNYQGADLKSLSSDWDSAYSNLVSNSAAYLSAVDLSFLSVSSNWDSTHTTVQNNSADWSYQGTDLKDLSAVWQESYTNLVSNSAAYLSAVDLSFLSVSSNWDSVYTYVNSNSSSFGSINGTDYLPLSGGAISGTLSVSGISNFGELNVTTINATSAENFGNLNVGGNGNFQGNINTTGDIFALGSLSALNATFADSVSASSIYGTFRGGLVSGATRIDGNVTIYGDLSSTGTQTFANTVFATTSALSVVNVGTGPALVVSQQGTGDIASFYDLDQNLEILHVGGQNSTYPNVGVKVSNPNKDFTVNGDISASGVIWDSTGNSNKWNSNYTTVQSNSALWSGATGTFGQYVKVVGVDASTIQSCIDLCLSANSDQNFTVFVPPGLYKENLILKPSVALIGLGGTLNTLGSVISGYHTLTLTESQAQDNRIVLQDILFQNNNETKSTLVVAGSSIGQVRANGCYFSIGLTTTTGNVLSTSNNKSVYLDNCRLEMTGTNNSGTHIIQGNGPLYLFNTDINGGGRCIDLPYSATTTRVCTISGYVLTNPIIMEDGYTTTGLSVGMKVVGTGITGTQSLISEIVSLTSFRVNTGTNLNSYALSSTLTFGQTPYAEIHNSTIASVNGADVVRVGNGLLVGNNVNFTNTNTTGHGLYLSAGAVAGLAFSTFVISSSAAPYYAVNGQAGSYYVANGISYSSSALAAYNTSVNPLVSQFQYTGLTTSVANGGTGSTTAAGALTNLGAVPTTRTVSAGTGLTGGGDLSTNRTLTVSYGSTSTTSCVGNDSRLSDARTISFTTVPSLSTSTGTAGAVARDTNYLYVCVATNTWKRTALTAF
jgi:hypothetical protein